MKPVVLIHGYSAESQNVDHNAITQIYGNLPADLSSAYPVVEIDLSRYISLNDSVSIYDVARALDRVLRDDYQNLLQSGFHVIIHSTGALVIRNWLMLFSPKPSPICNLIYLAGANFGSGWAGIGQGQIARWGRYVFEHGAQRGVKILQALEFGSNQTLDMHLHFLKQGNRMMEDYGVQEFVIIGTQADPDWFEFPVRYAKEDGSDGTVRVSASNVNFNYLSIGPKDGAAETKWTDVQSAVARGNAQQVFPEYYEIKETSRPHLNRPEVPFAIPYECAHTGEKMGIVSGEKPKTQVQKLIRMALDTPEHTPGAWAAMIDAFHNETQISYNKARTMQKPGLLNFLSEPRDQYDPHAQVVVRVRDQDGLPVDHFDIFFVSDQTTAGAMPIQKLMEDTVKNGENGNIITFYLRLFGFNKHLNPPDWEYRLDKVADFGLEITAIEPATSNANPAVAYLPLRMAIHKQQLVEMIQPHRTTIIDVKLLRIPSPDIYRMIRY